MIHNEISHHGPNIAHRSLSQKPVQDGCPSGEHPHCSFNYVVDITRHYKATGNGIHCTGGIIPKTVGDRDYMTTDR